MTTLAYRRSSDQGLVAPARHPVIIVGAGPVGLSVAIDLARQGVRAVVLDDDDRLASGSRAICFAKRTLEIFDRLGCGERMVGKGVSWNVGKVFFRDEHVYTFNLLSEGGHRRPAFINLQQYHVEAYLVEHAKQQPNVDLRWKNLVTAVTLQADHVEVTVETPDGTYRLAADYVVACDGSRSTVRSALGLETKGRTFRDRFLIADVRMQADFPTERWFWFDPPFHRHQSVLLHRQPDNVWRIDFQLGWDADPEVEKRPENVVPRIRALLGPDRPFELEWVSVYTFSCQRMQRFRHGRVLFAGDSAHGVSPFGARGANSGIQDADNLGWKLRLVLDGRAPDRLLDSYADEREYAADENILASTRSTDFITPKNDASRTFREAVLRLAKDHPFARRLVNSGRLSVPTTLATSPLISADSGSFEGGIVPGAPLADAPIAFADGRSGWLLESTGDAFTLLHFAPDPIEAIDLGLLSALHAGPIPIRALIIVPSGAASGVASNGRAAVIEDSGAYLARRYDGRAGTTYLVRPDQHVCARWRSLDRLSIDAALARATCNA